VLIGLMPSIAMQVLAEPPLLNAYPHNAQQARLFMLEDILEKFDQNR